MKNTNGMTKQERIQAAIRKIETVGEYSFIAAVIALETDYGLTSYEATKIVRGEYNKNGLTF